MEKYNSRTRDYINLKQSLNTTLIIPNEGKREKQIQPTNVTGSAGSSVNVERELRTGILRSIFTPEGAA